MSSDLNLLDQFEVGGTFFEMIEFSLDRKLNDGRRIRGIYGVNVAKVREVVHMPQINPLASRLPGIAGIFELRGVPIPAINLCRVLGDDFAPLLPNQQLIVTEFSEKRAGFIVSTTHRIRRVAWEKVLPPSSEQGSFMSGMILIEDNKFLFILDLEMILSRIESSMTESGQSFSPYGGAPDPRMGYSPFGGTGVIPGHSRNLGLNAPGIVFVDDSKLVVNNVTKILVENGYRVVTASNGVEAFEKLTEIAEGNSSEGPINCLITDVEMPLMDGLSLVKKLRAETRFAKLPILLHTSLSGDVTQTAAQNVGANGYVVKNDVRNLLAVLQDLLKRVEFTLGVAA